MSPRLYISISALAFLTITALAMKDVYNVNVTNSKDLGEYIKTRPFSILYYFLDDAPGNGISNCSGKCAGNWPPFYVEDLHINPELNPDDFTEITRDHGQKQLAY